MENGREIPNCGRKGKREREREGKGWYKQEGGKDLLEEEEGKMEVWEEVKKREGKKMMKERISFKFKDEGWKNFLGAGGKKERSENGSRGEERKERVLQGRGKKGTVYERYNHHVFL